MIHARSILDKRKRREVVPILPPGSIVRLVRPAVPAGGPKGVGGARYMIGYYALLNGIDRIQLFDEHREYIGSIDMPCCVKHYTIERVSRQVDWFGIYGKHLPRFPSARRRKAGRVRRSKPGVSKSVTKRGG